MRVSPIGELNSRSDVELVILVQNGDTDAFGELSSRYQPMLHARATRYANIAGVEMDDFVQEGLIALFRAAKGYRQGGKAQFKTYATTCINHSMSSAIKLHYRQSRQSRLLESASPETVEYIHDFDELDDKATSQIYAQLSEFEQQVLRLYLRGHSYQQISQVLSTATKSVDNALQRVRRKLRPHSGDRTDLPVNQP